MRPTDFELWEREMLRPMAGVRDLTTDAYGDDNDPYEADFGPVYSWTEVCPMCGVIHPC